MRFTPTLHFSGACREAAQLYAKAFCGEITCLLTYGEVNDPAYTPFLKANQQDYVYHAELRFGDQKIIMSDIVDMDTPVCHANFLTVMCNTKEEVQRAYDIMKEGSTTVYEMCSTWYSSCRVSFVDRFGIRWGIMTGNAQA